MRLSIERTNTVLYCSRWQETVDFYRSVLDLPIAFANDWFVEFELTATSFLSVANAARSTIDAVGGQGITITAKVADVVTARQALVDRGVEVTPVQRRWGSAVVYLRDPERHRLELWSENDVSDRLSRRRGSPR